MSITIVLYAIYLEITLFDMRSQLPKKNEDKSLSTSANNSMPTILDLPIKGFYNVHKTKQIWDSMLKK
jgi:hypothetical protein